MCTHVEQSNASTVLVKSFPQKRPLGRPRHRWKGNIKMVLRILGVQVWNGFIWFRIMSYGRLV
jgi:hypothetical protein